MAQHRLFTTAEIVYMILSLLSVSECARTLTINSLFFYQGVKLVWRELAGPAPLLALFCDQTLEPLRVFGCTVTLLKTSVPETVCPRRWKRSRIYADWVRKVTGISLLGPQGDDIRLSGIKRLLPRAPVAPKVNVIEDTWGSPDTVDVVEVLLGPFTSTLYCRGSDAGWYPSEQLMRLLERAQAVGSNLTDLAVRTAGVSVDEADALASRIANFQQLSSVEVSSEMLTESVLDRLRSLPDVRHFAFGIPIEIAEYPFWESFAEAEDWTGRSFPSLRSLKITRSRCPLIVRVLSARRSLLVGLTKLEVQMFVGTPKHPTPQPPHLALLVELIVSRASRLEDLSIVCRTVGERPFVLPPPVLALLFSLNLRRLALHAVRLPTDLGGLALIDGKWPLLSYLAMPYQRAGPADLLRLAKREPLQHLWVDVVTPQLGGGFFISETEVESSVVPMRLESLFEVRGAGEDAEGADEYAVETMARLLLHCWPSVCLMWRSRNYTPLEYGEPEPPEYVPLLEAVNGLRGNVQVMSLSVV
ncbi:hypothetical protein FRC12_014467 [Ceratobasidium sp. 428]|nr:hypothetical protein FRC12_014467 [Ceratobasidium sp. 428]